MWKSRLISARNALKSTPIRSKSTTQFIQSQVNSSTIQPNFCYSNPVPNFRFFSTYDWTIPSRDVKTVVKLEDEYYDGFTVARKVFEESTEFELPVAWMDDASEFPISEFIFKDSDTGSKIVQSGGGTSEVQEVENVGDDDGDGTSDGFNKEVENVDLGQLDMALSVIKNGNGGNVVDGDFNSRLESLGLDVNEAFVMRVIETPDVPSENFVKFFEWAVNKEGFDVTARLLESLVRAIVVEGKKEVAYRLWDLVQELGRKKNGVVTTESLNGLIDLFSRLGEGVTGYEVFSKFEDLSCKPDPDSYYYTVEGLWLASTLCEDKIGCDEMVEESKCRKTVLRKFKKVFDTMEKKRMFPEPEKVGKIISYLCKAGRVEDAYDFKYYADCQNKIPSPPYLFHLVSSMNRARDPGTHLVRNSICTVNDLMKISSKDAKRKHLIKPFSWVMRGLSLNYSFIEAEMLLCHMTDDGPSPGVGVFNDVIYVASQLGYLKGAKKAIKQMVSRGLKPDVFTYSVMICGYVRKGNMEEATSIFNEAKKNQIKFTLVTYQTLIWGYANALQFDKAVKLLNEMEENGLKPTADEYNRIIHSLWKNAKKLMAEMKEKRLHLDETTKGLIRAVEEEAAEPGVSFAA